MTLHEQSISNQKNERHATWKETAYWCNQWRLLAEKAITTLEATAKEQAEQIKLLITLVADGSVLRDDDEATITRMRSALVRFGRHTMAPQCAETKGLGLMCNCGLDATLEETS